MNLNFPFIRWHAQILIQLVSIFGGVFISGYPNLTTFIQAYPDVFVLQLSKTNPALNEVSVSRKCICKCQLFVTAWGESIERKGRLNEQENGLN